MIYTNIMITVYAADVAKVRLIMAWYDMKIVATERPEENEKIVAFSVLEPTCTITYNAYK